MVGISMKPEFLLYPLKLEKLGPDFRGLDCRQWGAIEGD